MKKPKKVWGSGLGAQQTNRESLNPQPRTQSHAADLLLEIGTEELPAAYLPTLIEQLHHEAAQLLKTHHLSFHQAMSYGTPRRLMLIVKGLESVQRHPGEEIRGPSKQAAYDAQHKPTQALLGFLRSHNANLAQTKIVSMGKGDYVYLVKPPTITSTVQQLPTLLPQLIGTLRAPKTMRWNDAPVRFARPIRWLLALYGTQPLRVHHGGLSSQPQTKIGRPQALRMVRVSSIEGYFKILRAAKIQWNQIVRQQHIQETVTKAAKASHGTIAPEMLTHGLLEEVTFLTEQPVVLIGEFDKRYLELPREVLLASMAKHQRVFAIESNGRLLPYCIAVLEGPPKKPHKVRRVIERILNARLADSLLFWTLDRRTPLHVRDLRSVTFHEQLGSMEEKTQRLAQLSHLLAQEWHLTSTEAEQLQRACLLAKADLVTTMVREFPTLQGVMGKQYALQDGEGQDVAQAIEEHYLPLAGKAPQTLLGSALSILDKYDTLVSYFRIGIQPTGDQDPFGLRRAAQGIVEVAWRIQRPLRLPSWEPSRTKTGQHVWRYILDRLYTFEWPRAVPADCIEAVLSSPCEDLLDVMERIRSLAELQGDGELLKAAKVVERTRNILKSATVKQDSVDPSRFQETSEHQLWERYQASKHELQTLMQERAYSQATKKYGQVFFAPLHDFFDRVMVNVPDETLKQNRLALMKAIQTLYTDRIADLSKLTILQQQREETS